MVKFQSGRKFLLVRFFMVFLLLFLILIKAEPGEIKNIWHVVLYIKAEGEAISLESYSKSSRASFIIDASWQGFLEEDGQDFIIYRLESSLKNWKIWTGEGDSINFLKTTVNPVFCLDYVEGLEEEVRFYYSFNPSEIIWAEGPGLPQPKFLLPSAPWQLKKEAVENRMKVQGQRLPIIERAVLNNPAYSSEFFWKAEIHDPLSGRLRETLSVRLALHIKKLITEATSQARGWNLS